MKLQVILDALILVIKRIRKIEPTIITIFSNLQATITKILDPKAKVGENAIQNLVY